MEKKLLVSSFCKKTKNPLNVRVSCSRWLGSCGSVNGFVRFTGYRFGVRAAIIVLRRYMIKYRLLTVKEIVSRWAPSSENDTDAYICFVCLRIRVAPDIPLSYGSPKFLELVSAMAKYESNFPLPSVVVAKVIKYFGL